VTAVLSARNRMTRSTDFDATVKHGIRAVQPDMVIHLHFGEDAAADAPRVGLIVSRAVGSAVQRHQMARRLRHAAREVLDSLGRSDRLVIRALPSGRDTGAVRLADELRAGLRRAHKSGTKR
jgi:ribonuclease P protein component